MKVMLIVLLAFVACAYTVPDKESAQCYLCKMLVQYVEQVAEDDEPSIEGAIDHLACDHLGPLKQQCYAMVHQWLPLIIQGVEDGQPPNVVCGPNELGLCRSE